MSIDETRQADSAVEAIVAIMQRHGLRIDDRLGTDGPGDLWTAAHEIAALTTEAAEPLTPKSPVSESRSGVVCRPTEGKPQ